MKSLFTRHAAVLVSEALLDTPIVVVQGARQVGKSTLVQQELARLGGRYVTLDEPNEYAAATADPTSYVAQCPDCCLGIDEVQRAPGLVLALKASVDADRRPGRFLLTGSANLLRLPTTHESLAGRAESVELFGLSQGELEQKRETFVDALFAGESIRISAALDRADYLERACAGGYPEALERSGRRRQIWFDEYVRRIIQRDAPDVSNLRRLDDLPRLLRLIAASSATEVSATTLARGVGDLAVSSVGPYVDLLQTLYLVHRVNAWSNQVSKRITKRPKLALLDAGLVARLTNVRAGALAANVNPTPSGPLLETFVLSELRKQLTWSDVRPALYHYRDRDGAEVDVILEADDGRIVALEVKASASLSDRDFRWLRLVRDRLGKRFVAGAVLYPGPASHSWGERLSALPLCALWRC